MNTQALVKPLPKTVSDLIDQRKGKFDRTLNDMVEDLYLKLWENSTFQRFLEAVQDGEAVEGSLACDDHEAARMLREAAQAANLPCKGKPLASFKMALKVVMRRYQMSRRERLNSLRGEAVPGAE